MHNVTITLPFPPATSNTAYGHTRHAHYSKECAKEYKQKTKVMLQQYMKKHNIRPFLGEVKVEIAAFEPDKRVRDEDNVKKLIYDSITGARLWKDDSLVRSSSFNFYRNPLIKSRIILKISDLTRNQYEY